MRYREFADADDQVAFIKFMLDATWAHIEHKLEQRRKRQEGQKKAALASKRASIVRRNRASKNAQKNTSLNSTGRPQRD
ncbi:MAG TPA: hypothetical protein PKZ35_09850 [Gammaproteobacteria bacterium]|nr:hypothetical protein [Gammaproteobacteria bacterium]